MAMASDLDARRRTVPGALLGALALAGATSFVGTAIAIDDGSPLVRAVVAAAASWAFAAGARTAHAEGLADPLSFRDALTGLSDHEQSLIMGETLASLASAPA